MLRPIIHAPIPSKPRSANSLSTPVSPPSWPCSLRQKRQWKTHSISSVPLTPSGFWRSWLGPAPYPSIDSVKLSTRSLDTIVLQLSGQHRSSGGYYPAAEDVGNPLGRRECFCNFAAVLTASLSRCIAAAHRDNRNASHLPNPAR